MTATELCEAGRDVALVVGDPWTDDWHDAWDTVWEDIWKDEPDDDPEQLRDAAVAVLARIDPEGRMAASRPPAARDDETPAAPAEARLLIVGDGPVRAELEQLAAELSDAGLPVAETWSDPAGDFQVTLSRR